MPRIRNVQITVFKDIILFYSRCSQRHHSQKQPHTSKQHQSQPRGTPPTTWRRPNCLPWRPGGRAARDGGVMCGRTWEPAGNLGPQVVQLAGLRYGHHPALFLFPLQLKNTSPQASFPFHMAFTYFQTFPFFLFSPGRRRYPNSHREGKAGLGAGHRKQQN